MSEEDVKVTVEIFDEEKYQKNIQENDFSMKSTDGIGDSDGNN